MSQRVGVGFAIGEKARRVIIFPFFSDDKAATASTGWKIGSLARDTESERSSEDDDEFFDCLGTQKNTSKIFSLWNYGFYILEYVFVCRCEDFVGDGSGGGRMVKWSSLDLLAEEDAESAPFSDKGTNAIIRCSRDARIVPLTCGVVAGDGSLYSLNPSLKRTSSERGRPGVSRISCPGSPTLSVVSGAAGDGQAACSPSSCKINTLLLVVHAGSILGKSSDGL